MVCALHKWQLDSAYNCMQWIMGQCINHRSLTASLLYLTSHQKSTKGTFNGASSATSKMHTTEGINWYSSFHLPAISFSISPQAQQKHDYNKKGERWSAFFCWLASRPRQWIVCLVSTQSIDLLSPVGRRIAKVASELRHLYSNIDILAFVLNHSNKLQFSVKHNDASMCLII